MVKALGIYSYVVGRNKKRYLVCNPDHDYPHKAKGVTIASGFKSFEQAKAFAASELMR